MDFCFHMDNLKKFKILINKNPDDLNKYYSEAIKLKSYKILTYIVNELNYIEDYFELKKNIPSEYFNLIKDYLKKNKTKYYLTFSKYLNKLIENNNYDNFTELLSNEIICVNPLNMKLMCKLRRNRFISYTYEYNNLDNISHQCIIFEYCIIYDNVQAIDFILKYEKTQDFYCNILDRCSYYHYGNYIESFIDLSIILDRQLIFERIIKSNLPCYCHFHLPQYYTYEKLCLLIDNVKPHNENCVLDLLQTIIQNKNYDFFNIFKYLLNKFPFILTRNRAELKVYHCNGSYDYAYFDTLSYLLIYDISLDIIDYYIEFYKNTRPKLLKEKDVRKQNKIQEKKEIEKFKSKKEKIKEKKRKYKNIKEKILFEDDDEVYLSDEILINNYIPFLICCNNLEFIKKFFDKYNIIEINLIDNSYFFYKHDYLMNHILNLYNFDDLSKNFKKFIENLNYLIQEKNLEFCENKIILNKILDYEISNDEHINILKEFINTYNEKLEIIKNLNVIIEKLYEPELLPILIYILEIIDINIEPFYELNNTKKFAQIVFGTSYDNYQLIKSKLTENNFFKLIKLINYDIYFDMPKYIFIDVIKYININEIDFTDINNKYYLYNTDFIVNKIDLILEAKNKTIHTFIFKFIDLVIRDNLLEYTLIIKYFKYLNGKSFDEMFFKVCRNLIYPLIRFFIYHGKILTNDLVKKYKIDMNRLNFNFDVTGKLKCMICYTNSPSVITLPCTHLIMCNECYENIPENKCRYDCLDISKSISLKGKTEKERISCLKCKTNRIEFVFEKCGHSICSKCCLHKFKCPICNVRSNNKKIFIV